MKLLLTGGGTAGHVNPALAIAEIFKSANPETEIFFAGTPGGMERRLVGEVGYPYYPIRVEGFSRSLSPRNLRALYLALTSPIKARSLLRSLSPDLVVGTGGYVSWPMLSAAASLGIPTALHESNVIPGLTVRRLAPRCNLVLLNFEKTKEHLGAKVPTLHVGNPLRRGFSTVGRAEARRKLGIPASARLIVSFGGSLGAESINRAALTLFCDYVCKKPNVYHIHGTGMRYKESFDVLVKQKIKSVPPRIRISEYLGNMPELMAAADLLICRAGAMTISELARTRRAAILIPSPNVAGDHQTKNAALLEEKGAAYLLPESELDVGRLLHTVGDLLENDEKRIRMEKAIARFDIPDANRRIGRALSDLVTGEKPLIPIK